MTGINLDFDHDSRKPSGRQPRVRPLVLKVAFGKLWLFPSGLLLAVTGVKP